MKYYFPSLILSLLLFSCKTEQRRIVDVHFADSTMAKLANMFHTSGVDDEITFWKNKVQQDPPGAVNELKYSAALTQRFRLSGNINDLLSSDSLLLQVNNTFGGKEPYACLSLMYNAMMKHEFRIADSFLSLAIANGIRTHEAIAAGFDVDFELGRMAFAKARLQKMKNQLDYNYKFREAKWLHYEGTIEAAITSMKEAAALAGNNITLLQAALSNTADLYLHSKDADSAFVYYQKSLSLNKPDLHSLAGIGRIALLHDKDSKLADKIFRFVQVHTSSPDILLKLSQVAEMTGDSAKQFALSQQFQSALSQNRYGNMHNKNLIILYTSALNNAPAALVTAEKELANRVTPQTYAWKVWALFKNGRIDDAYSLYQSKVSGKPLEALELFWMGQFMKAMNKGYNAKEMLRLAAKNAYDLSPAMIREIENAPDN